MRSYLTLLVFALLSSCAGWERGCASGCAKDFGADWVIVQFDAAGTPFGCWILRDKSVSNEPASDGVYWVSNTGHLVHISGFYNRVQVTGAQWQSAFAELGITRQECLRLRSKGGADAAE